MAKKYPKITKLIYVVLFPISDKEFRNPPRTPPPQQKGEKSTASFYGFYFLLKNSFKKCLKISMGVCRTRLGEDFPTDLQFV
jgi:hypothetical protein